MVFSSALEQGPASSIPQAVAKEIETWAAEMGASNLQEKWEGFSPFGKAMQEHLLFQHFKRISRCFCSLLFNWKGVHFQTTCPRWCLILDGLCLVRCQPAAETGGGWTYRGTGGGTGKQVAALGSSEAMKKHQNQWLVHGKVRAYTPITYNPYHPCMVYLPTFTISIKQM